MYKKLYIILLILVSSSMCYAQQAKPIGYLGKLNAVSVQWNLDFLSGLNSQHDFKNMLSFEYSRATRNHRSIGFGYSRATINVSKTIYDHRSSTDYYEYYSLGTTFVEDKSLEISIQDYKIILGFHNTFAPVGPYINWNFGIRSITNKTSFETIVKTNDSSWIEDFSAYDEEEVEKGEIGRNFFFTELAFGTNILIAKGFYFRPSFNIYLPIITKPIFKGDDYNSDSYDFHLEEFFRTSNRLDILRFQLGGGYIF